MTEAQIPAGPNAMLLPDSHSMLAVAIAGSAGPASALHLHRIARPVAQLGQVLIAVHAAGINRPDVLQRLGFYPPPPGAPSTLGLEVAGEVVTSSGPWRAGDRVCALVPGGGYAQYAVCDERHVLPVPTRFDFEQAAGLPETVFTVYANVFEHGALKEGETFLVHGATSGIGITAIQMAKAAGAKVIATARSAEKAAVAKSFGADVAVDVSTQDYADVLQREGGADVVLNMIGGDYFGKDLSGLRMGGRIVFIAGLGGAEVTLPITQLMQKRAIVTGSTLRARSDAEKARLTQEVRRVVWPWIESGRLRAQVDRIFPLSEAGAAHAHLESGTHVGKVILKVA